MELDISQQDIDRANSFTGPCVTECAMQRAGFINAGVGFAYAAGDLNKERKHFKTSESLYAQIHNWIDTGIFVPGTYELIEQE